MAKQGESIGPSGSRYSQTPVVYENKSIKRETRAMNGDGGSSAVRPQAANKDGRKTGRR